MGKTKKVGKTGRYGARYGSRVRKKYNDIITIKDPQRCPKCFTKGVKRLSVGIWYCKKCGAKFTGGAYLQSTKPGVRSARIAKRLQTVMEKLGQE
ncbi:MAG: 50S ribosomal protein L37ae [Candidatus Lokiarchaeota archaeon]|nr:50S ribosomal protein L37ae [Candidatus Lokiarchaeota archaeon]